jgi:hypothetical protein
MICEGVINILLPDSDEQILRKSTRDVNVDFSHHPDCALPGDRALRDAERRVCE